MPSPDFLRIERDEPGFSRHFVVHTREPAFAMELVPDLSAPDRIGEGILMRLCVPNSWRGDYEKYSQPMDAARQFFAASFGKAVPKGFTRRLGV